MTEKERMLSQQLYMASDPELVRERREAKRLTRLINDSTEDQAEYRIQLFKELFGKVGKNIWLEPPLRVDYGCNTYIGDNFFANYECIILDVGRVIIGDNVMFGPRVGLYAAGHPVDPMVRNSLLEYGREIRIGNNVWVGGNVTINPGVTIGDNVIIGSGSVVTKDIPANVIAAGVPCKVLREITPEDQTYWEEQARLYWEDRSGKQGE